MNISSLGLSSGKVYIYGYGLAGRWLAANLDAPVEAFIDTDEKKVGKSFNDIPVISLDTAQTRMDVESELIVTVMDVQDVLPQIARLKHKHWVALGLYLDKTRVVNNPLPESASYVEYSLAAVENCHKAYYSKDRLFLRSLDLVITEKCSLKCKDCSNLMQYYVSPVNVAFDELKRDFDQLLERVDHIYEIRLIGGEPFMNKEIYRILRYIVNHPKISLVVIYSNAMIPIKNSEADIIQHPKVLFSLTDYGELAQHTPRIAKELESLGATYRLHPPEQWTDSGVIFDFQRSEAEMKQLFAECCGKNLFTVSAGQIYRCPFAANADRLRAVPRDDANSVSVSGSREDIRHYVSEISHLPACNYCKGRSFGAAEITPAIQTPSPLPYHRYG